MPSLAGDYFFTIFEREVRHSLPLVCPPMFAPHAIATRSYLFALPCLLRGVKPTPARSLCCQVRRGVNEASPPPPCDSRRSSFDVFL